MKRNAWLEYDREQDRSPCFIHHSGTTLSYCVSRTVARKWTKTKGHTTHGHSNTHRGCESERFFAVALQYLISEISEDLLRVEKKYTLIAERGKRHRGKTKEMASNPQTENLIEARMPVFCFHMTVIPWMGLQNKRLYLTMSVVERCWNQWWQRLSPHSCACVYKHTYTHIPTYSTNSKLNTYMSMHSYRK